MTFDPETIIKQIPYYLTAAPAQKQFAGELKALIEGASSKGYFSGKFPDPYKDDMLQGDGWPGFQMFSFNSGKRLSTRGIVLSNSCDLSPDNERPLPPRVTFAPIVKLSALRAKLKERGFSAQRIDAQITAMREQSVANVFYLPAEGPLGDEYFALFRDLHSMPLDAYMKGKNKKDKKLFTLSMVGFYFFVFKLSIHFCRLQENIDRTPQGEAT